MKYQFGFFGCGNMGGALLSAVLKKIDARQIGVCERHKEKIEGFHVDAVGATVLAKEAKFLFLGVKPQALPALFEEIRPILNARKDEFVLVSMAAGVSTEKICELAGGEYPVIRIMPNTPVKVGEGMTVYTANLAVKDAYLTDFSDALSESGNLDRIPEEKMDAAGALSGCGPAFVYLFAEALADGGVECGLTRKQANLYAAQTLLGAAKMLLESRKGPGELKDAVCSPGGTTIAGVHALENGKLRGTAMDAVIAAYEKTKKLK